MTKSFSPRALGLAPTNLIHRSPLRPVVRHRRIARFASTLLAFSCVFAAGACSTGDDAAVFGGTFTFVSPDGQTDLAYPPDQRGTVGSMAGTDVADENSTLRLEDYPAKVMVLNFWGSWCPPCRAEADDLNAASEQLSTADVQFLGLNVRDTRSSAADFTAGKQTPYPSIYDPGMTTLLSLRGFPTGAIPSTLILDKQHRVAQIWLGAVTQDQVVTTARKIAAK